MLSWTEIPNMPMVVNACATASCTSKSTCSEDMAIGKFQQFLPLMLNTPSVNDLEYMISVNPRLLDHGF